MRLSLRAERERKVRLSLQAEREEGAPAATGTEREEGAPAATGRERGRCTCRYRQREREEGAPVATGSGREEGAPAATGRERGRTHEPSPRARQNPLCICYKTFLKHIGHSLPAGVQKENKIRSNRTQTVKLKVRKIVIQDLFDKKALR